MYYGIIMTAAIMFSLQFLFNQQFEKQCGSGMRAALVFSAGYSAAGLLVLLIINGFRWEFSWFSLIMAILTALNGMAYTFCSLKAFGKINLSLYSVFSMLGGMMLPFIFGILFFRESLSTGKLVCVVLVAASLFLTVERGKKNTGIGYYIGIFVLNGMSGVLSKIFQAGQWAKTSEAGYSVLSAAAAVILSLAILPFIKGERIRLNIRATGSMLGYGVLNKVGNFLLLISLAHLPASAQYPMVTGGVMIVSTVLCYFTPQKPSAKEIGAVLLSFAGILALVLIP
ncbi:MAG: hypothetical protein KH354_03640 [Clostridiales bacterium]|nr:hypothetical protein [Clostridiales bacterium]